jgi:hypothetical protein
MCAICEFRIEFSIGHPLALTVAVATRKAIEEGRVDPLEADDGALAAARRRMTAVEALNLLQARIESGHASADLLGLPDFYVLLIENDTWAFFHATTEGFDPDIVPDMPDVTTTDQTKRSNVIVTSEAALRGWLSARFDMSHALSGSLVLVDATGSAAACLTRMLFAADSAVVAA